MPVFIYLKLSVKPEDTREFEDDLRKMHTLERQQPGYVWSEITKLTDSLSVYVLLSEWESRDNSRTFEHLPAHEEIIHKWDARYTTKWVKKRYNSM